MRSPITLAALSLLLSYHTASARQAGTANADFKTSSNTFVENKGQIVDQYGNHRTDIDFKLNAGGMSMFIGNGQLHYQWYKTNSQAKTQNSKEEVTNEPTNPIERRMHDSPIEGGKGDVNAQTDIYRLDVELVGANTKAQMQTEEPAAYYENYYLPQCPDGATAHSYGKVIYKNIYPNIDWVIYTMSPSGEAKGEAVKYDFIVHPGGNPADIKLAYKGATSLTLNDGALTAVTPLGSITEQKPYSYIAGTKQEVNSSFVLKEGVLSFNVGKYEGTLVIDPALIWGTYYGGNNVDVCYGLTTDTNGALYMAGYTGSTNNIATTGAFQTTCVGAQDAFIAKFSSYGTINWATYYGGNGAESFFDLDTYGTSIYAVGVAYANGLGTPGVHRPNYIGSGNDLILVRFTSSGSRVWATYYGGTDSDVPGIGMFFASVACDISGNIYIGSTTISDTGIATSNGHQVTRASAGPMDCYIAKIDSNGQRLWGSYYGGIYADYLAGISTDVLGNVYLYGNTTSANNISTPGAYQAVYNAYWDGFIAKFNSSGVRQWGTYIGGNGSDNISGAVFDKQNNFYITGSTESSNGIATVGCSQPYKMAGEEGFLMKFNSSGNRVWGTYIGGPDHEDCYDVTLDTADNIYVSGRTTSSKFIATPGSYQSAIAGTWDAFWMVFSPAGNRIYGTYYGGPAYEIDGATRIRTGTGAVYITGETQSTSGIATTGAYQITKYGSVDGYLAKFSTIDTGVYIVQPYIDTLLCTGDTLSVKFELLNKFNSSNYFILQLSNSSGSFSVPLNIDTVYTNTGGTFTYVIPSSGISLGTGYRLRIVASSPYFVSGDNGYNISIGSTMPASPIANSNSPVCQGDTIHLSASSTTIGVNYFWTGPNYYFSANQNPVILNADSNKAGSYIVNAALYGCVRKDTVNVVVNRLPGKPDATNNTPICAGDTLKLFATDTTAGVSYSWIGPNGFNSSLQNPFIANCSTASAGNYVVYAILNGCKARDTVMSYVRPLPTNPSVATNSPLCSGDTLHISASSSTSGVIYSWSGPNGFSSSSQNNNIANTTIAHSGNYIATITLNGCSLKDTAAVTVNITPAKPIAGSNTPVCPGTSMNLTASSGTAGVTYSWTGPGSFSSASQNPVRTGTLTSWAGNYIVTASLNGCSSKDTEAVAVYITTPTPVASSNSPLCAGADLDLTSSTIAGATYIWTGPGSYSATTQNPVRNNSQLAYAGQYIVTANINGCISLPDTVTVVINPGPTVGIYPSPNDTICQGGSITFIAISNNGGTAPGYQWYKNTAPVGGNNPSFNTSAIATGDVVYCTLTNNTTCSTPAVATSNNISVTVLPYLTPSISITANPATPLSPWQMVSFTATAVNGGASPQYQWKRNGVDIQGATAQYWSANNLSDKDTICCVLTSSYFCPQPATATSNSIVVDVLTGVGNIQDNKLKIYPNPVNDRLIIEGAAISSMIQVFDVLGREVLRDKIRAEKHSMSTSGLSAGTYILQLTNEQGKTVYKISKE